MAETKFEVGMLVRAVEVPATETAEGDPTRPDPRAVVGQVLIAQDHNGDVHVQFPQTGAGVFRPDELVLVDDLPQDEAQTTT